MDGTCGRYLNHYKGFDWHAIYVFFNITMYCFFLPPDLCIACGDMAVVADHPLFHGALCKDCKVNILHLRELCMPSTYVVVNSFEHPTMYCI